MGRRVAPMGGRPRPTTTRPLAIIAVIALTVVACAPTTDDADAEPQRPPVVVDASLGVVRVAPGEPIVVRMVLDTDDPEGLAPVLESAFRAAVEDFGAIQQDYRVDLGTTIPAGCSATDGARIGDDLAASAEQEGIVGILGPQCTSTLLGLQAPASDAGLLVLAPRSTVLTLTEGPDGLLAQDRAEGMWRTVPSELAEARAAAVHAVEDLGATRAVVIGDGSLPSAGLVTAFRDRFEERGGTVVLATDVDAAVVVGALREEGSDARAAADAALGELLDAAAAATADVAFLPFAGTDAGPTADEVLRALLPAWSARGALDDVPRITTSRALGPDLRPTALLALDAALDLRVTAPVLDLPDAVSAVTGMSASQTLERVAATSGVATPPGWWAYAYDAATLLLRAVEDGSLIDVDGSLVLSRAELRDTVARTRFEGLTGPLRCSPLGDCAAPRIRIHIHEDPGATALSGLPVVATVED